MRTSVLSALNAGLSNVHSLYCRCSLGGWYELILQLLRVRLPHDAVCLRHFAIGLQLLWPSVFTRQHRNYGLLWQLIVLMAVRNV
jgi:hypothetical protein